MNYKLFLIILSILTVISTLCICVIKPQMHKSVMVYNSEFKIVPQSDVQVEVKNIPTVAQNQSSVPQAVKVIHFDDVRNDVVSDYQTYTTQAPIQNTQITHPQVSTTSNKTYTTVKTTPQAQTKVQTMPVVQTQSPSAQKVTTTVTSPKATTVATSPQIDLQKILENNKKYQNYPQSQATTSVSQPKTVVTDTPTKVVSAPVGTKVSTPAPVASKTQQQTPQTKVQTTTPSAPKVLTPQEEEIAWQIWRSNLQNRIMQDAKLPNVPQGTIFKFTFDVDKYGKVSNVYTSCTNNPQYTPYAIQYIAPVIKAYQGRSILNFPEGSKRTTTSFVGSFRVSNTSKYSTAGDYKDTERINK